eukprot:1195520-Prorocentrum_minimum.AAC.10
MLRRKCRVCVQRPGTVIRQSLGRDRVIKFGHVSSHSVTSHHIRSRRITFGHVTSHSVTSHHIRSRHITFGHTTSHSVTLHHIRSRHITFGHITSHSVTPHHIRSRRAALVTRSRIAFPRPEIVETVRKSSGGESNSPVVEQLNRLTGA